MLRKKGVVKFKGKHLCQSLFFNKFTGFRSATLSGTGFFPVNFEKLLRTPLFKEHLRWLLPCLANALELTGGNDDY